MKEWFFSLHAAGKGFVTLCRPQIEAGAFAFIHMEDKFDWESSFSWFKLVV